MKAPGLEEYIPGIEESLVIMITSNEVDAVRISSQHMASGVPNQHASARGHRLQQRGNSLDMDCLGPRKGPCYCRNPGVQDSDA